MTNIPRVASLADRLGVEGVLFKDPGYATWATWLPRSVFGGVAVLVTRDGGLEFYTHTLEAARIERLAPGAEVYVYSRYPLPGLQVDAPSLRELLAKRLRGRRVACGDDEACREAREAGVEAVDAREEAKRLRMVKTGEELERIREALRIAEDALAKTVEALSEGLTEIEVAGIHEHLLRRLGSEGHAFAQGGVLTIVAFGENTAYPHWDPGRDKLRRETPVLIDTGAVYERYLSDVTRSTWFGASPDPEWRKALEAVEHAVGEAVDAVEPGVEARVVDEAARRALGAYARHFPHATGHGVGVEVHEEPSISPGSKTRLEEGMVFTIEPGVYIPRRFGVRIEQMVVVEARGARVLNHLPLML